jgi:hypothetical protein
MIQIYDYIIEPESQAIGRFNLYKNTFSTKTKKTYRVSVAYAITLIRAIDLIAEDKATDEAFITDLKEFITEKERNMKSILLQIQELYV